VGGCGHGIKEAPVDLPTHKLEHESRWTLTEHGTAMHVHSSMDMDMHGSRWTFTRARDSDGRSLEHGTAMDVQQADEGEMSIERLVSCG
jgi:hypothetical protein